MKRLDKYKVSYFSFFTVHIAKVTKFVKMVRIKKTINNNIDVCRVTVTAHLMLNPNIVVVP